MCLKPAKDGLKGHKAVSPGPRPGYSWGDLFALKGQKPFYIRCFCPFRARSAAAILTQGVALGCQLKALSGHIISIR